MKPEKLKPGNRIAVIGGGLGGLAAACTLAARGHHVELFERNAWLGGKAAVWQQDGFRFDMGPTILTLPSVLRRIFAEAGVPLEDHLDLVALDPQWRCFFNDGQTLDLHADTEAMQQEIRRFCVDGGGQGKQVAEGYGRFMDIAQRLDEVSHRFFFWKNVGSVLDTMDLSKTFCRSTLSDLLALRMGQTVGGTVRRHISDPRVAQMVDHFTQYVGSCPSSSPAVLCGIAHMQTGEGVWYPRGGTAAVPRALQQLAERLGVTMHCQTPIEHIEITDGHVRGIRLKSQETRSFDAVVSNSDCVRTHDELVDRRVAQAFHRRRRYEPACSGVVMYLGLKERYDHLLHHNFVFSKDPESEFDAIYRQHRPAPDPTCYVCAPAVTESEVAPDGGEALYVLVHTPYLQDDHDWTQLYPNYRETILDKLESTGGLSDIRQRIVTEHKLTPQDIHTRYHVHRGAIYGLASHGRFFGAFKPANRSPDVQGLYLAGGSAHPGAGMPMALMSGWIAADTLDQDYACDPAADLHATQRVVSSQSTSSDTATK